MTPKETIFFDAWNEVATPNLKPLVWMHPVQIILASNEFKYHLNFALPTYRIGFVFPQANASRSRVQEHYHPLERQGWTVIFFPITDEDHWRDIKKMKLVVSNTIKHGLSDCLAKRGIANWKRWKNEERELE